MADLRQQRRIEQLDGDREALEHIARALEGRVLPLSAACAAAVPEQESARSRNAHPHRSEASKLLLEEMPAAIARAGRQAGWIHANAAFAYAFGYRALGDLIAAGGLDAILPQGFCLAGQRDWRRAERADRCADPLAAPAQGRLRRSSALDDEGEVRAAPPHRPEEPRRGSGRPQRPRSTPMPPRGRFDFLFRQGQPRGAHTAQLDSAASPS